MALSLNETKKKRKKDRGGRALQNDIDSLMEDVADTSATSSESVLDAMAEGAAEIVETATAAVEAMAEQNPFVAPWSSEALKSERPVEKTTERTSHAASASAHGTTASAHGATAKQHTANVAKSSAVDNPAATRSAQTLSDFYMRMNPMAVQLSMLRASFSWSEACYEANKQIVETAQSTFSEIMKIWATPFRRRDRE